MVCYGDADTVGANEHTLLHSKQQSAVIVTSSFQNETNCDDLACRTSRSSTSFHNQLTRKRTHGSVLGWLITVVSFLCNGIVFGIINCYGILYVAFLDSTQQAGVSNAAFKCALVGSLGSGLTFFMSLLSGVLVDTIGIRRTAVLGSCLVSSGLMLSSLATEQVEVLYLTYGLMFGTGASLLYTPSLVILGHYHHRHLGLANGLVACGSSVFTMIMTFFMTTLIPLVGLQGTLQALALMSAVLIPSVLIFLPARVSEQNACQSSPTDPQHSKWSQLLRLQNWKNRRYLIWAVAIPLGLFGYFVPYVHLIKFVNLKYPDSSTTWFMPCIGLTSGFGRILFGKIADFPRVNKIALQQVAFIVIGVSSILLAISTNYWHIYAIVLAMGLFDGCFVALIGPVAFQLVNDGGGDVSGASQAIGSVLTLCSLPLTIGPPLAGYLYDQSSSYTLSFVLAGCPPIIAAVFMCIIHRTSSLGFSVTNASKQQMIAQSIKERSASL